MLEATSGSAASLSRTPVKPHACQAARLPGAYHAERRQIESHHEPAQAKCSRRDSNMQPLPRHTAHFGTGRKQAEGADGSSTLSSFARSASCARILS